MDRAFCSSQFEWSDNPCLLLWLQHYSDFLKAKRERKYEFFMSTQQGPFFSSYNFVQYWQEFIPNISTISENNFSFEWRSIVIVWSSLKRNSTNDVLKLEHKEQWPNLLIAFQLHQQYDNLHHLRSCFVLHSLWRMVLSIYQKQNESTFRPFAKFSSRDILLRHQNYLGDPCEDEMLHQWFEHQLHLGLHSFFCFKVCQKCRFWCMYHHSIDML